MEKTGGFSGYMVSFGDFNGDGKADGIAQWPGTSSWSTFVAPSPGTAFEQIGSVSSGLGATTQITYQPLTKSSVYTKDSGAAYPLVDVQGAMYVVSRVDSPNGIGGTVGTTYSYVGARADLSGRGFLGFRQMKSLDLQSNILQTTTYGRTTRSFRRSRARAGRSAAPR